MRDLLREHTTLRVTDPTDPTARIEPGHARSEHGDAKVDALDFEIFGRVQLVGWRRHMATKAAALGITGTCENMAGGSVAGVLFGTTESLSAIKRWVTTEGPPGSRVDRAEYRNERKGVVRGMTGFETGGSLPVAAVAAAAVAMLAIAIGAVWHSHGG
jgi:acylphosphatase